MGHPDLPGRILFEDRHTGDAIRLAGETLSYLCKEAAVDLLDDFEVARKEHRHKIHRPLLESFRQQGVLCRCEGAGCDVPRSAPGDVMFVNQDPHQFGDSDHRMRVV